MLKIKLLTLELFCIFIILMTISCNDSLQIDNNPPEVTVLYEPTYVTKSSIELVWGKNTDDDFYSYVIFRDSISNVTDSSTLITTIYKQDSTRYIDMNLKADMNYYYRIFVFDKSDNYSMSNIINAMTEIRDYCLELDGVNDYIEVLDDSNLNISGHMTLEAWIKPYSQFVGYIFWKYIYYLTWNGYYYDGNGHGFSLSIDSDFGLTFDVYDGYGGRGYLKSSSLPTNEWVHIAAVYNSDSIIIYINGVMDAITTYKSFIDTNNINLRFGNSYNEYGNFYHYKGAIDGIRISDISRYHENFIPKSPSDWEPDENTVGLWYFNEDVGDTIYDYSNNENYGLIYGAKWILH